MRTHASFCSVLLVALVLGAAVCHGQEQRKPVPSPDGRFVFQYDDEKPDVPFGIFDATSGKMLFGAPDDTVNSFVNTVGCVWSPDSKQFVLNYRAGSRYNTLGIYRWDGKTFVEQPSFESLLSAKLEAIKAAQLKKDGIGKEAYIRRIWDSYTVRRWIDAGTVEVDAYSIRAIFVKEEEAGDVTASLRCQLQRDKKGKWKVTSQKAVSIEEMEKNDN